MALILIIVIPIIATLLCWLRPFRKWAWPVTVISEFSVLGLAIVASAQVLSRGSVVGIPGWIETDGLGVLVLLIVSFVTALASVFAGGYMRRQEHDSGRLWRFYCNYNLFAFALLVTPTLADPNLAWVGVELITLFAILLVGFEETTSALEAAWKYAVLTMMGAPTSLLGFFVLFWGYHSVNPGAHETWASLQAAAPAMNPNLLRLGFLLILVGFGSKSGLAPMHTWLPDAHSQAPSPVCAVLSGVKTTVPLYAILRVLSIILASPGARVGSWLITIGLISVGVAAFLLLQVRDYKRMFAYSTVEHMGIILTGAGLATNAADFGAVSQMLNHAITKSLCFYVAGTIVVALSTREIKGIRSLFRVAPFSASALVICSLAIAGAPPFPIFISEFSILSAGVRAGQFAVVTTLAVLIVIAFIAIFMHVNRMLFGKPLVPCLAESLPSSCRLAVMGAAVPVILFGVYLPPPIHHLLQLASGQLGGH